MAGHRRRWAAHQTITGLAHAQATAVMRRSRLQVTTAASQVQVEQRRLSDYDVLLGVDGIEGGLMA